MQRLFIVFIFEYKNKVLKLPIFYSNAYNQYKFYKIQNSYMKIYPSFIVNLFISLYNFLHIRSQQN